MDPAHAGLREEWLAGLPLESLGVLTGDPAADGAALDAWASKRTGGQIDRMPLRPDEESEFVLASALALRTEWFQPFTEGFLCPESGPWEGRCLTALHRTTSLLDRVGVVEAPAGSVTELKVIGDTGIDAHLLLGEELISPGQALGAGVDILARTRAVTPGPQLPYGDVGPGLRVRRVRRMRPMPPTPHVTTVPFSILGTTCSTSARPPHLTPRPRGGPGHRPGAVPRGRGRVRELRPGGAGQNCSPQESIFPTSCAALSLTRSFHVPLAVSDDALTVYVVLMSSELPPVP